jgi:hypothetical protein
MGSDHIDSSADQAAIQAMANEASCLCEEKGHLWGDPYSFGGRSWHRDCYRCYESEDVSRMVPVADELAPHRIVRLLSA